MGGALGGLFWRGREGWESWESERGGLYTNFPPPFGLLCSDLASGEREPTELRIGNDDCVGLRSRVIHSESNDELELMESEPEIRSGGDSTAIGIE